MIRGFKSVLACAALLAVAATAFANPVVGTYRSTDLGGALFTGHASQSWTAAANASNGVGDVYNALSWNGALGTQWGLSCGIQGAPQLVQDNRVAGTGTVVYTNSFAGGRFYFNNGPWCSSAQCAGNISQTVEVVTVQYVSNIPAASVININTSGTFDNSNCNLTFAIGNGIGLGDTDGGPKPATYPDFLDTACNGTRTFGSWGDIITITARVDCPVPVRQSTWGALKAAYR